MTNPPGVIIIGGGIGGLMTAIALNREGISSTVYEKTASFAPVGAGLALWANATALLDRYGLLEQLLPYGNVLHELQASTGKGRSLGSVRLRRLEAEFAHPSFVLLRADLQRTLLNALPPEQIQWNKACTGAEQHDRRVTASFSDGSSVTGSAIIFADGIHSVARQKIFGLKDAQYAGRTSWRAVAEFDTSILGAQKSHEIFGVGKRIGIFPLPGNRAYWYAAVNMSEAEAAQQAGTIESVQQHFRDWSEPVNTLFANTTTDHLVLTPIRHAPAVEKLAQGSIALLGDAAHPMTPDLGQGACQAIEDACCIAGQLARYTYPSQAFSAYEQQRLPRVQTLAKHSYRMGNMRQMNNRTGFVLRNLMMRVLPEKLSLHMISRNIRTAWKPEHH